VDGIEDHDEVEWVEQIVHNVWEDFGWVVTKGVKNE